VIIGVRALLNMFYDPKNYTIFLKRKIVFTLHLRTYTHIMYIVRKYISNENLFVQFSVLFYFENVFYYFII